MPIPKAVMDAMPTLNRERLTQFYMKLPLNMRREGETILELVFAAGENITKAKSGERENLYSALMKAQGKVTEKMIMELIENGIRKGDANILRVLAQCSGVDMSEKPAESAGEGAKIIVFRPIAKEEVKRLAAKNA